MSKIRPEFSSGSRGFEETPDSYAGIVWGLDPDSDYEVRVSVSEPDTLRRRERGRCADPYRDDKGLADQLLRRAFHDNRAKAMTYPWCPL